MANRPLRREVLEKRSGVYRPHWVGLLCLECSHSICKDTPTPQGRYIRRPGIQRSKTAHIRRPVYKLYQKHWLREDRKEVRPRLYTGGGIYKESRHRQNAIDVLAERCIWSIICMRICGGRPPESFKAWEIWQYGVACNPRRRPRLHTQIQIRVYSELLQRSGIQQYCNGFAVWYWNGPIHDSGYKSRRSVNTCPEVSEALQTTRRAGVNAYS